MALHLVLSNDGEEPIILPPGRFLRITFTSGEAFAQATHELATAKERVARLVSEHEKAL